MDLISISQKEDTRFETKVRRHHFISDMSLTDGGSDAAPAPAEYLVASLGNCIGMVISSYCTAHNYGMEKIAISMTYMLADNPKRIQNITIDIELPENFPSEKKKVIMNLIKCCPIYNSLHPGMEIDIEFE